jgi:hypothetical protein
MPITRDADFPAEIGQLVQSFNRCADGHDMTVVIEAAGNMFSAAIHNYAAARVMTDDEVVAFARKACHGVFASVELNWRRHHRLTDVEVKAQ